MSKLAKILLGLLLISWVAAMTFWALYRRERNAKVAAQEMTATSMAQVEGMRTELAAIRELISQFYESKSAAPPSESELSGALSELKRQLVQLHSLQSNSSALVDISAARKPLSPEDENLARQQAITELAAKVTTQEERVTTARVKLDEQIAALNVTDEIALVETSVALKLPSLRSYWPYFEARKELEEALDFAGLLKRKLRIEEFQTAR